MSAASNNSAALAPCSKHRSAGRSLAIDDASFVGERLLQRIQCRLDLENEGVLAGPFENDSELVAAEPADGTALAKEVRKPVGQSLQKHVPGVVPDRVVGFLQMIDVEQHQSNVRTIPRGGGNGAIQPTHERRTVGQARHPVMIRRPSDPVLDVPFLGHVADCHENAVQPVQWCFDPPPGRLHPSLRTCVGAPDPYHRLEPVPAVAGTNCADQSQQLGLVVRNDAGQRDIDGRCGIDRQAQHRLELLRPFALVVGCIIVPDA